MELSVLKKKIDTYRTKKGRITKLPTELMLEILHEWENWTGPSSGFYKELGSDHRKMASIIGKAKGLKRDGGLIEEEFREIDVDNIHDINSTPSLTSTLGCQIELVWEHGKIIRFKDSDLLLDFLKKVA